MCSLAHSALAPSIPCLTVNLQLYFILTNGASFLQRGLCGAQYRLDQYEEEFAELADDPCGELNEWIPPDLRECFRPVLLSLLCRDPARRASVEELTNNEWLMSNGQS